MDARSLLGDLRPQRFSAGTVVHDPIVEPDWTGVRVLAAVGSDGPDGSPEAFLVDKDGKPLSDLDPVVASLRDAVAADSIVVDGILTKQATHDGTGTWTGPQQMPSMGKLFVTSMIGQRPDRAKEEAEQREADAEARRFGPDEPPALVIVDLLSLDGQSILDVPLMERKRLLESVIVERDLVRVGIHIKPPVDTWVGSWRAQGFRGLTYKAANSRYLPGSVNPDWITVKMPRG